MVSLSRFRSARASALASTGVLVAVAVMGMLPATSVAGQASYQRPLDIVFIIDRSGSMDEVTPVPGSPIVPGVNNTRLGWANDAANNLVAALESAGGVGPGGLHQVGLVTYGGGSATVDLALGPSGGAQVHASIDVWDGLDGNGNTPLKQAMAAAVGTMTAGARTDVAGVTVLQVFILLSDGRPNPDPGSRPTAADIASYLAAADQAFGIAIGATGTGNPGSEPDLGLMQAVSSPPANFAHVVDAVSLPNLFASITEELMYGDIQLQRTVSPTGAVEPGTPVTFTYVVWNNSEDTPLTGVAVSDTACGSVSAPVKAGGNNDGFLAAGEQWTYTCTTPISVTTDSAACATGEFIGGGSDDACADLTVDVNSPTPTPTPTPVATPEPTPTPTPAVASTPTPTPKPSVTPSPKSPAAPPPAPDSTPTPPEPELVTQPSPSASEQPAEMTSPAPTPEPQTVAVLPSRPVPPAPPAGGGTPAQPTVAEPTDVVGGVLAAAVQQVATVVNPEAAAVVATAFSFPLALMGAVVFFLVGQGRIDARDPKLRSAPRTPRDTVLTFQNEEEL